MSIGTLLVGWIGKRSCSVSRSFVDPCASSAVLFSSDHTKVKPLTSSGLAVHRSMLLVAVLDHDRIVVQPFYTLFSTDKLVLDSDEPLLGELAMSNRTEHSIALRSNDTVVINDECGSAVDESHPCPCHSKCLHCLTFVVTQNNVAEIMLADEAGEGFGSVLRDADDDCVEIGKDC